jgi:hypothetical protein
MNNNRGLLKTLTKQSIKVKRGPILPGNAERDDNSRRDIYKAKNIR